MLKNSYWNHNGTFESAANELQAMIPAMGEVENPRKNRKLEKFRKACNVYSDLYNNGLCNRAQEFRQVLGIASSKYKMMGARFGSYREELYIQTEQAMDKIVIEAAEEQAVPLAADHPRTDGVYA